MFRAGSTVTVLIGTDLARRAAALVGHPTKIWDQRALRSGHKRPKIVATTAGYHPAQFYRPFSLVTVLITPHPHAPRAVVQRVLVGESHGAVRLVSDCRPFGCRLSNTDFGGCDLR